VVTSRIVRTEGRWARVCGGAGALLTLLVVRLAHAQVSDEDKALALQLFDEGRSLMTAGKLDDACRKLEESKRLDPLPGTLLNVAVCHEQQGRTATAVAEFREAKALAERDQRADRVALADQHLKALDGKVSSVVIVVPPEVDRPDLSITRDGAPVGRAAWGTRLPVDPGQHAIEASAANKKPWKVALTVGPNGDVQTATLAPLEDAPPAEATPAPPPAAPAPPPAPAAPAIAPVPEVQPEHPGLSTRRTIAVVTAGAAVVAAGVGTYFGLKAISKHNDPNATCTLQPCSDQTTLNNEAKSAADVSTVSFAIAGGALVAGAILWFTDTSGQSEHAGVYVTPEVAWGRGGIDLGGRF
jgi:hypothetical protein